MLFENARSSSASEIVSGTTIATLRISIVVLLSLVTVDGFAAEGAGFDEEVVVVGTTPTGGKGIALDKLPFNVQAADSDALQRSQSLDLTDFLNSNFASVNINSAQNNPLQPDVQYRGFTASPLLGLPMGDCRLSERRAD